MNDLDLYDNPVRLYRELTASIGNELKTDQIVHGLTWNALTAGDRTAIAMSFGEETRPPMLAGDGTGLALSKLSKAILSWNMREASIAMTAINAWYNTRENIAALTSYMPGSQFKQDAFLMYQDAVKGKNVAVIGHFPYLEKRFAPYCTLSVLERMPIAGDYPDSACEFILPQQDFVFITGCTLINKTLPRLLALAYKARVILVGPTVPLTPMLFRYGIESLCGFIVTDRNKCLELAATQTCQSIFQCGEMVTLTVR